MKKIFIIFLLSFGCTSIKKSHLHSPVEISVKSDLKAVIEVDTSNFDAIPTETILKQIWWYSVIAEVRTRIVYCS